MGKLKIKFLPVITMITPSNKMTKVTIFMTLAAVTILPHVKAADDGFCFSSFNKAWKSAGRGRVYRQTALWQKCGVYYERQDHQQCALHAVNCILHSARKNPLKPEDMYEADGEKEHGNWGNHAVRVVLNKQNLSCDEVVPGDEKVGAVAWIITDNGHWHSYVKNDNGRWFDVESYHPKRYKICQGSLGYNDKRTERKNWRPRLVGNDDAMVQRLREWERKCSPRRLIYRVERSVFAKGQWFCTVCGTKNDAAAIVCLCTTPQPGSWTCKMCDARNKPDAKRCSTCTLNRPGFNSAAAQTGSSQTFEAQMQAAMLESMKA